MYDTMYDTINSFVNLGLEQRIHIGSYRANMFLHKQHLLYSSQNGPLL